MQRRIAALAVLTVVTAVSGIAQIILGSPFPGQGQRRYPGQQPYPGQQQPTTDFVGQLDNISSNAANGNFVMETDDHRTVTISLDRRTKFIDPTGRNAKITIFQPGDHVEASCIQDNNGNYLATKLTQLRVGSAEDRTAAGKGTSTSSAGPPPDDDSDPDRPRLHRAGEGDNTNTSRGNTPLNTNSSNGRPSVLTDNSASSIDDDSGSRRRRAVSSADDTPGAQISGRGANGLPDDGFSPSSAAPSSANSSRPVLARNSPPPAPAPAPIPSAAPVPTASTAFPAASAAAPAWLAKQTITKTQAATGGLHAATWKPLGTATSDYLYKPGADEYAAIRENVTPPGGAAELRNKREEMIHNHAAWRYDFTVPLARSHWHISSSGQSYGPGYTGSIWIEKGTGNVLRIEASAQDLPDWFPVSHYEMSFDYNLIPLGTQSYLLPSHADVVSCQSGSKACVRSVTEFSDYRVQ